MAVAKRKPGRPAKHIGLSHVAPLKVEDGDSLRSVRAKEQVAEESVLHDPRPVDAVHARKAGIFGAARPGEGTAVQPAVPDNPQRTGTTSLEQTFTSLLRGIALESAADRHQDTDRPMSNLEVLARKVFDAALSDGMGSQKARELLVDRLEGKAGRAATPTGANTELDDQLDRTAVSLLNELVPTQKDAPND